MRSSGSFIKQTPVYAPRLYFLIFLIANTLLAYTPLNLLIKLWIGICGILVVFLIALFSSPGRQSRTDPAIFREPGFFRNPWVWIGLGALAVVVRLYRLTSLPAWPMWDDAYHAFFAIKQMQHWSYQMYFTMENLPFPFYWIEAFYFRLIQPSLVSLWLFPALFSIVLLPLGYWACRKHFSASFSFLLVLILAFSFWPVYLEKFCLSTGLQLVWEFASLGLWGLYLNSFSTRSARIRVLLLGFGLGLGFYTYLPSYPTIGIIALLVLCFCFYKNKWKEAFRQATLLVFPVLLLFLPMIPNLMTEMRGGHTHDYMVYGNTVSLPEQLKISFSYFTVILWGTLNKSYFNFGPLWGGFLNPFLGSAFLLGWIEIYHFQKRSFFWLMVGIFLVYLIPASFTTTVEIMRILQVLPFCLLLTGLGIRRLVYSFPASWRIVFLVLFFVFSMSLDAYHLCGPYHRWAVPDKDSAGSKSPEHFQAFQIIDQLHLEQGPGLVFTDFYYNIFDQSLYVSTYGYNAAANPQLDPSQAKWAAVLMAPWDVDVFKRRFPTATLYDISKGLSRDDNNEMRMAVVALEGEPGKTLRSWVGIHNQLQNLFPDYPFHVKNPSFQAILGNLWEIYGQAPAEPFIKNCLMEKIVDAAFQSSDTSGAEPFTRLPPEALWHPPFFNQRYAVVFHRLGMLNFKQGRLSDARRFFLRAAQYDPEYPLKKALALLNKN